MGQPNSKAAPVQPRDPMDIQLDLRMTWKRLESESKRSLKEQDKNVAKAKEALKKNNEEGAKLFLQTAMAKKQESENLQKMATKIQFVESQVKSAQANADMMQQLNVVTPIMQQYTNNMSIEQLYQNINQFDRALDDIMVQGKVMDSMMNKNSNDFQTNMAVDQMMQQLKKEEALKLQDLQPSNMQFQQIQQQQQQPQYQNQQQYQQQKY
ncbi:unnamed protein product (macronuclear) [Paramecium tetraurelia]|uniref:Uncharacterized protein n=1 Tax=Paramecium tetraurelia TaxID=5888 RepID=A0CN16_PARTE|nr:uncharacterized protein GSPATT00008624001 [Paramecium tetraurelia]CAK72183.1 unnamed protein product [Paramecium tetraurelia]|eukprot:XP_001439580.1 hypothetical protein (macronuclear) [Paramecium tetraurelia strain d4-2]